MLLVQRTYFRRRDYLDLKQFCLKGKWYVRRFDPDTVQNGHIYSTMEEEKVLAQLVERQSAVREVDGSSPRPDQHSGS